MKRLFMLFALFVGFNVAALARSPAKPWYVCKNMTTSAHTNQCVRIVKNAQGFDPGAALLCNSVWPDSLILSCMSSIANGQFQKTAMNVCYSIGTSNQDLKGMARCLSTIKNRHYSNGQLRICGHIERDSNAAIDCLKQ